MSNSCNPRLQTRQAPLSMGFSGQEHWSGLPFPAPAPCSTPIIEIKGGHERPWRLFSWRPDKAGHQVVSGKVAGSGRAGRGGAFPRTGWEPPRAAWAGTGRRPRGPVCSAWRAGPTPLQPPRRSPGQKLG